MQNNYVEELKSGKQIRIKYDELVHDWVSNDSGWKEELWRYDSRLNLFKCYYPISTYERNFYTVHTEDATKKFMDEAERDKERNEENVADIIVEDCNIPNSISGGTDMSEKYLRITLHDNDFITSLSLLADILYNIFINEERFPEEDEFSLLGKYLQPLLFSLHNIRHIMRGSKNIIGFSETLEKYFEPTLELVDGCDIPDWDDCGSVYIPMFTNGKILIR